MVRVTTSRGRPASSVTAEGRVETVLWLFLAAMVVDGTDGFLARHDIGLALMALKYAFDAAFIWLAFERLWTPHRMTYIAGKDQPPGCPFCSGWGVFPLSRRALGRAARKGAENGRSKSRGANGHYNANDHCDDAQEDERETTILAPERQ